MRRNRKREPLRVSTVGRSLLICGCVAVVGLAYVWQKNQIYRLGDEIKKREAALSAGEKRTAMLAAQLAHLKSPALLEQICQKYNLGLVAPRENQIVRVYGPGSEWDTQLAKAPAPVKQNAVPVKVVARR